MITGDDEPVAELHPAPLSRRGAWSELTMAIEGLPYDDTFADDLEKVNDSGQPMGLILDTSAIVA